AMANLELGTNPSIQAIPRIEPAELQQLSVIGLRDRLDSLLYQHRMALPQGVSQYDLMQSFSRSIPWHLPNDMNEHLATIVLNNNKERIQTKQLIIEQKQQNESPLSPREDTPEEV